MTLPPLDLRRLEEATPPSTARELALLFLIDGETRLEQIAHLRTGRMDALRAWIAAAHAFGTPQLGSDLLAIAVRDAAKDLHPLEEAWARAAASLGRWMSEQGLATPEALDSFYTHYGTDSAFRVLQRAWPEHRLAVWA